MNTPLLILGTGMIDCQNAFKRLADDDIGGALQCIEFALQQLEAAKKKLMK